MDKVSLEEIKRANQKYEDKARSSIEQSLPEKKDDSIFSLKGKDLAKGFLSKKAPVQQPGTQTMEQRLGLDVSQSQSAEFRQFEAENKGSFNSSYERYAKMCGDIIKISPGEKQKAELKEALWLANLNVEPEDTFSFAIFAPLVYMLIGLVLSFVLLGGDLFFVSFFLLSGIALMLPLTKLPFMIATTRRLKSSKEIVLCIFYIVTYMRQNSNLEKAIEFAAQHLSGPLATDLKQVLWNVETEKFSSIQESLDNYLVRWKKTNGEFLESMNLIQSSLFESKEDHRIALLDKSLDIILTETYEKMIHYTHKIQSPISTLHMLGIILPILGLVILPLVVSFMEGVRWYHLAILYNVCIPVGVLFVSKTILASRPGGSGNVDISENNPLVIAEKQKEESLFGIKLTPKFYAISLTIVLLFIGLSPLIVSALLGDGQEIYLFRSPDLIDPDNHVYLLTNQDGFGEAGMGVLGYRLSKSETDANGDPIWKGPYAVPASMLGMFIPLSFAYGLGLYFYLKTKNIIKIRDQTKKLEDEFGSAVFQLGNRLGDGIPLEMAFRKVSEVMPDSAPGRFFTTIDQNIRQSGFSVKDAIFDKNKGALIEYPSNIIDSTMRVLSEAIQKGPLIASRAMINVSRYVKEMHSVEERLKDLLAEVISSMNSLVRFLAPVISGIVVGITSMITTIIGNLSIALEQFAGGGDEAGALSGLTSMFGDGIPTYYFQIVVGLYIVQIVVIVAQTISGIGNGDDKLGEEFTMGQYLLSSVTLYAIITFVVMVIFNVIATSILGNIINSDI